MCCLQRAIPPCWAGGAVPKCGRGVGSAAEAALWAPLAARMRTFHTLQRMACVAEEVCPPIEVTTAICAFRYTSHEMNCGAAIENDLNNNINEYLS